MAWNQNILEREGFGLCYDESRDAVVLYGGRNGTTVYDDTWEGVRDVWVAGAAVGPGERCDVGMAYFEGHVMLFGGWDGTDVFDDMWIYDGTAWSQVQTTSPGGRYGHELIITTGGAVVTCGGRDENGDISGETWQFNGTTWSRATDMPTGYARADYAFVFLPARNGNSVIDFEYDQRGRRIADGLYSYDYTPDGNLSCVRDVVTRDILSDYRYDGTGET